MGAVILWRPKNGFDWLFLVNLPISLTFVILLLRIGRKDLATMQFFFGFAIAILSLRRSKKLEAKKELEEIMGEDQ